VDIKIILNFFLFPMQGNKKNSSKEDYFEDDSYLDLPEENDFYRENSGKLSNGQKIYAGFLAFFAVFFIILWTMQLKNNITNPLAYNEKNNTVAEEENIENNENLKNIDTDKDGLSDYDELNIYNTSPYLEDTDADGIKDKEEIDKNTDPNCPAGRVCATTVVNNNNNEKISENTNNTGNINASSTFLNTLNVNSGTTTGSLNITNEKDAEKILSGDIDAKTLRQLLQNSGMDKKELDKISDDVLMKTFKDMLGNKANQ